MKIKIGGVPEHFNFPWHFAIQNGMFSKIGLDVSWTDVKGGSGAMCKMLANEDLDLAVVLTEGIIKDIAKGGTSKIIHQYVKSPLIWGIHASKKFQESKKDLSHARFARSRVGSGSHVMTYVLAEQMGWPVDEDNFVTVGNIDGAVEAFENNEADILLWEKFMTRPLVQAGKMFRIGDLVSPWPCFVLVASEKMIKNYTSSIAKISEVITEANAVIMKRKSTIEEIANHYALDTEIVREWYTTVEWQTSDWISAKMLENVIETLNRVGAIENEVEVADTCISTAKIY